MRVRAIETGYFGCLRVPGTDTEEFEVPNGAKATWFVPVEQKQAEAQKPKTEAKAQKPKTEADAGAGDGLV